MSGRLHAQAIPLWNIELSTLFNPFQPQWWARYIVSTMLAWYMQTWRRIGCTNKDSIMCVRACVHACVRVCVCVYICLSFWKFDLCPMLVYHKTIVWGKYKCGIRSCISIHCRYPAEVTQTHREMQSVHFPWETLLRGSCWISATEDSHHKPGELCGRCCDRRAGYSYVLHGHFSSQRKVTRVCN